MKRVFLFLAVNFAILIMLGITMSVLQMFLGESISGFGFILLFSLVFGMGGAFISLWISKPIAKWSTGAKVIEQPKTQQEMWLINTVKLQAQKAGIKMPEVAIYPSMEINAFATGATKNSSLVAVSQGLLQRMDNDQIEAILGHEVSHIANGDMVTMTLLQGVLNTLVLLVARIIGGVVDRVIFKNEEAGGGIGYFLTVLLAQILLGLLASIVVMAFSRHREFRADAGGASLSSTNKMIYALQGLSQSKGEHSDLPEAVKAFGIRSSKLGSLFSSHPPLEDRIKALQNTRQV